MSCTQDFIAPEAPPSPAPVTRDCTVIGQDSLALQDHVLLAISVLRAA